MRRNALYEALAAQLATGLLRVPPYNVQLVSRGFVHWEAADIQPAIYVETVRESSKSQRGQPNTWTAHLNIWVYQRWIDSEAQGAAALSNIQDGVDLVLSATGPNGSRNAQFAVNNLGGLCDYCALQGDGDVSSGFLSKQQAIARMPVVIVVAG